MDKSTIELKNYMPEIQGAIDETALQWLEEAAGELEGEVKRNSAVGQPGAPTKSSWVHQVDRAKAEAYVGSASINAVYEEYGTGEHAAEGNGRSTPWYVPVEDVVGYKKPSYQGKVVVVYGKGGKKFYKTDGKQPKMTLHNAYEKVMPKAKKALITKLKKIK